MGDILRVYVPFVQRNWPLKKILREKEHGQLCGAAYFSLGAIVTFTLFPPGIATTSVLWLVLGDLSAALIGVSFGGDAVVVKLGREGKKSLEGSVAMFIVCFVTGMIVFQEVPLCEYGVFFGSLVATLTELYEPFGLNDNLTIPVFSSLALTWGLMRIHSCTRSDEEVQLFRELPNFWEAIYNASTTLQENAFTGGPGGSSSGMGLH